MKKPKKLVLKMNRRKFPTHALIYADWPGRIDHDELGHGTTAQRRHCKKYAESKGYFVKKGFGYSHFGAIFDAIQKFPERQFAIIVDSMDRITLARQDIKTFCEQARSMGATVESPNYDLTIPAKDQFKNKIRGAMEKYEHEMRSIKAQQAAIRSHVKKVK